MINCTKKCYELKILGEWEQIVSNCVFLFTGQVVGDLGRSCFFHCWSTCHSEEDL